MKQINDILKNFTDYSSLISDLTTHLTVNKQESLDFIEHNTLEFLISIKADDYVIGHSDNYFDLEIDHYLLLENPSQKETYHFIASLLLGLVSYMTEEECEVCQQSQLYLYTDACGKEIYHFCEECLSVKQQNRFIDNPLDLYPANKEQVKYFYAYKKVQDDKR